jgi:SAM-dependent methyltransferase
MTDAITHYETHLARVYAWSLGGASAAIAEGARWVATLPLPRAPVRMIELGAGFGAIAIPLARAGHAVVAVDTSAALLAELAQLAGTTALERVHGDLLATLSARRAAWEVVLCVGDTLPHLDSLADVERLLASTAQALVPGGVAVLAYRPRRDPAPHERFVLVRTDEQRTLTVFLEPVDDTRQIVWDLIHERGELAVSGYPKLRLDPTWVSERAARHGLRVEDAPGYRGMVVQLLRRAP